MEVLDKYGPVAVAIDASHPKFYSYSDDYYGSSPRSCNSSIIGIYYYTILFQKYLDFILYFYRSCNTFSWIW
jgi:hypothetical protein